MEDKILSLSVFPFPLCAAHSHGFQSHPAPGNTVRALVALVVLQLLSSACQTGEFAKIRSEKWRNLGEIKHWCTQEHPLNGVLGLWDCVRWQKVLILWVLPGLGWCISTGKEPGCVGSAHRAVWCRDTEICAHLKRKEGKVGIFQVPGWDMGGELCVSWQKAAAGKEKHNSLPQLPTSSRVWGVHSPVFHSMIFPLNRKLCIKCGVHPFLTQKYRASPKNQVYGVYNCSKPILPKEIFGTDQKKKKKKDL